MSVKHYFSTWQNQGYEMVEPDATIYMDAEDPDYAATVRLYECRVCGLAAFDPAKHARWHDRGD